MTVTYIISSIPPAKLHSSRQECMEIMMDHLCFELPVEKNGKLYGTVQLDECIHSQEDTIESLVDPGVLSVHLNTHIFDVLQVLNKSEADVCAVTDENETAIGIITKTSILRCMSDSLSVDQTGSILIIEMAAHQYSANEISRIIESESAQLLGLWLANIPESGRIRASLKLNTKNAERIIKSMRRFNYDVVATFNDDDYKENVERRFESLMKYIDI